MKQFIVVLLSLLPVSELFAQENYSDDSKSGPNYKQAVFTGGSLLFSISSRGYLAGGSPVIGYNVSRWADAGIVANYIHSSRKDFVSYGDKIRMSIYGGGAFTRLFPVRFLFAQVQAEHNWVRLKYIQSGQGDVPEAQTVGQNSILVGGGYAFRRKPDNSQAWGHVAVLYDIAGNKNSPYRNANGAKAIIRVGLNIPLFK